MKNLLPGLQVRDRDGHSEQLFDCYPYIMTIRMTIGIPPDREVIVHKITTKNGVLRLKQHVFKSVKRISVDEHSFRIDGTMLDIAKMSNVGSFVSNSCEAKLRSHCKVAHSIS